MASVREDVEAVLERYTFTGPLAVFRPRVVVCSGPPYPRRNGRVHCEVIFEVPERDTEEPYTVRTSFVVIHNSSPDEMHRGLIRAVFGRLKHEALESIRFDGEIFADPHSPASWRKYVDGG